MSSHHFADHESHIKMDPLRSPRIYPRKDNYFRTKESLNFDAMRSKIYQRRKDLKSHGQVWVGHAILGFFVGFVAFMMSQCEEKIAEYRFHMTQHLLDFEHHGTLINSIAFYTVSSIGLVAIACLLTVYFAPGATGSGVAEMIALLNGVNYPGVISNTVLLVKMVGTVLACSAGLTIGKESPLAHIGSILGVIVCHLPVDFFKSLQNDVRKREFIAAGFSAGVSAAFGAPIGGAMLSYEVSKPSTFWTFQMIWRIFLCCAISTFTLSVLTSLFLGEPFSVSSSATLKFGKL
jgi:chloride channel 7